MESFKEGEPLKFDDHTFMGKRTSLKDFKGDVIGEVIFFKDITEKLALSTMFGLKKTVPRLCSGIHVCRDALLLYTVLP